MKTKILTFNEVEGTLFLLDIDPDHIQMKFFPNYCKQDAYDYELYLISELINFEKIQVVTTPFGYQKVLDATS